MGYSGLFRVIWFEPELRKANLMNGSVTGDGAQLAVQMR